ncbi:DNA-processing protein DprA [Streptomyces antibioticus]|uniref:DNA-processing protein DprA n=1 Tax=Streptomyces antibioticus TaxID=1890 RepID=UPI0036DE23BA
MPARPLPERAARAALAAHFAPGQLADELDEYTPAEVWDRRVRSDGSGRLASYRPREELAQAELTCSFAIPSDQEWPTALADLGPTCPLGLWVRGRERFARLVDSAVAVTGNRVPTEQAVTRAHDFAAALAEAGHTVTATLAFGVDSTAHQAAAKTGRATLAVLPRGLDGAHPHAHAPLLRSILDNGGAAVSPYRPGTAASGATLKASAVGDVRSSGNARLINGQLAVNSPDPRLALLLPHARVARAGDVADGDLLLAAVGEKEADYFTTPTSPTPSPTTRPAAAACAASSRHPATWWCCPRAIPGSPAIRGPPTTACSSSPPSG